jgi:hypothetical protein
MEALATVAKAAPGIELTDDSATSFLCKERTFMFLLGKTAGERLTLAEATRRKFEVGIVAARNEGEYSRWSVMYHVLTIPKDDGEIGIVVSSAKGKVTLEGTAHVIREKAEFQIHSIDGAGALAIEIEGTFDRKNIAFRSVRAAPFRRQAYEPSVLPLYRTAALPDTPAHGERRTEIPTRVRQKRRSPKKK